MSQASDPMSEPGTSPDSANSTIMANSVDDERALRGLAVAYAHHVDRREATLLAQLFESDATLRMVWRTGAVAPAASRGHRQIAKVVERLRQFTATFHLIGNHSLEIVGDDASGEVYCEAHHLTPEGVDHVMFIRYLDRYRRAGGAWRFAERETFVEWTEERSTNEARSVKEARSNNRT
jgi:hypothetical protein